MITWVPTERMLIVAVAVPLRTWAPVIWLPPSRIATDPVAGIVE